MQINRHNTAAEFLAHSKIWLERADAENNLILGIAAYLENYSGALRVRPYFLTVHDEGAIVGAALMTPPRRLLITQMPERAMQQLAEFLLADRAPIPGVLGPKDCARLFAEHWCANTGLSARIKISERIHACTKIIRTASSPGYLRTATRRDESLLVKWTGEFCREAHIEDESAYIQSQIPNTIDKGWFYVWDDGEVVSMADVRRETSHGIAVSLVYTPPRWRRNGYASSCVAELTQLMLDGGKKFCCLFTDLANPTSNSIYPKIGYKPVCDVDDWSFE